jgi:NAD(P)-dependent dehydrogenase (short-subunit alcohol dehydrogenase family)
MARTVVVAGVGPGLGAAVARRFAHEGLDVALLARTESRIEALAERLNELDGRGLAVPTDLAEPGDVEAAFAVVRAEFGGVDILVYNASAAPWKGTAEIGLDELDRALDVGVRGFVACAKRAVVDMREHGGGTVVVTGATTSVRGREGSIGFSAAKFGARGVAESMARELGPEGIHVAHVVIDGGIRPPDREVDDPEAYLDPDAIADTYWDLVEQDRSAWTLELDLRPHVEEF